MCQCALLSVLACSCSSVWRWWFSWWCRPERAIRASGATAAALACLHRVTLETDGDGTFVLVSDLPVKLFNQLQDVKERRLSGLNVLAFAAAAVMVGSPTLATLPVWSEAVVSRAQIRAMNLARGTAVAENGGLSVYRPEPCMVQTSTGGGACFVSGGRGFTFNFLGDGLAGQKMAVSRPQKRKLNWPPGD